MNPQVRHRAMGFEAVHAGAVNRGSTLP
jgi:hypothetical protein